MTRVISGAVLIAFAVAVVWFASTRVFFGVGVILTLAAGHELVDLARAGGLTVSRVLAQLMATLTFAFAFEPSAPVDTLAVTLVAVFLAIALFTLASWPGGPQALGTAAASVLPAIYIGLPIATMVAIRAHGGPASLFLLMLTVIVSDTAQYYTGRAFGRRPLAPTISPKKTIEGAMGGLLFGSAVFATIAAWWMPPLPLWLRVAVGLGIVALGIAGDLFESMLKRSAGVKDSSALIPGHGGVLDRIDALLFAAPAYYIVLKYV